MVEKRTSVRHYSDKPVSKESLERVLNAVIRAPSAKNLQPYKFVLVKDEETRKKVAQACHGQSFMALAPITVVVCAHPLSAYNAMGESENSIWVDAAIAMQHLVLASAAEGLGTCWIGSFSENQVKGLLNVPDDWRVVALTPLGHPKAPQYQKSRKSTQELFCQEKWQ